MGFGIFDVLDNPVKLMRQEVLSFGPVCVRIMVLILMKKKNKNINCLHGCNATCQSAAPFLGIAS